VSWGGAVLLVSEHGGSSRRGLWASFPQAAVPAGNILATAMMAGLATTLSDEAFLSWGWRVAFIASAVLVLLGYYIRRQIEDAPVFKEALAKVAIEERAHSPLREVIRERKRALVTAMGLRLAENTTYYMVASFTLTYLKVVVEADTVAILNIMLLAHAVHLFAVPACGYLSDRIGRKPVIGAGLALTVVWAVVVFPLYDTNSPWAIFAGLTLGLIAQALMYGPQAAFFSEMFPTRMRYTGISISAHLDLRRRRVTAHRRLAPGRLRQVRAHHHLRPGCRGDQHRRAVGLEGDPRHRLHRTGQGTDREGPCRGLRQLTKASRTVQHLEEPERHRHDPRR
jgi:MFS family permease